MAALASICIASSQLYAEKFLPAVTPSLTDSIQPPDPVNVKPPVQAAPRVFSSGPMAVATPMQIPMTLPAPVSDNANLPMPEPLLETGDSKPVPVPMPVPMQDEPPRPPQEQPQEPTQKPDVAPYDATVALPSVQHFSNEPIYKPHACHTCQAAEPTRWLKFESLIWWTSGVDVPVIATTSPQGTPGTAAGIIGQPTTQVLYLSLIHI